MILKLLFLYNSIPTYHYIIYSFEFHFPYFHRPPFSPFPLFYQSNSVICHEKNTFK